MTTRTCLRRNLLHGVLLALLCAPAWYALGIETRGSSSRTPDRTNRNRAEEKVLRLREGVELRDETGQFEIAGERVRFRPTDRDIKLIVLENLALERVSRVLEETRSPPTWSVSGRITEYHGSNFLLITRAVVKSR